jgi:hypothetical protein
MKVIHLPTAVGGNASGLARAERQLGLQSDVLVLSEGFKYPADKILFAHPINTPLRKITTLWPRLREMLLLADEYDIFHFNFGTSLIDHPNWGLPLADLAYFSKKGKIIVTYNGCDARQKFPTMQRTTIAACHDSACYGGGCNSGEVDKERRKKIQLFSKYADAIFALNPDLLYFLPEKSKFLPYTISRWNEIEIQPYLPHSGKIQIVHAPTNRVAKGSAYILAALDRLKQSHGEKFELRIIENKSHAEALAIYQQADLIIDQVLIGWYGAFAVECMKMGKPVMVYIREEDLHFIPEQMAKSCLDAFIRVTPETIYAKLVEIVENNEILLNYRKNGLEYVLKWHDPLSVAKITNKVYLG